MEATVPEVTDVDAAPQGTDATISADEDSFRLLAGADFGFVDPDGAASLYGVIISATAGGTLYYDADGAAAGGIPVAVASLPRTFTVAEMAVGNLSWRADPNVNGSGVGTITFQVIDDSGGVSAADNLITIDVVAVNDAPALTPSSENDLEFVENGEPLPLMQGVTLSDPDAPADFAGGSLTLTLPPGNGSLILRSGSNFVVNDLGGGTFALSWRDGATELPFGTIAGYATTDLAITGLTGFATLVRLNDLIDDFVYANASDTPVVDFSFLDPLILSLTVSDGGNIGGGALTANQTQRLLILPTDDPTVAQDDFFAIATHTLMGNVFEDNGAGADFDPDGPSLSVATVNGQPINDNFFVTLPSGALVRLKSSGELTYHPLGTVGTDSFTYTVTGGDTATVNIQILQANERPSGQDETVTIDEDGAFIFAAADFGFADLDGDAFAGVVIDTLATNGTLLLNGAAVALGSFVTADQIAAGGFAFVPGADAFGTGHAMFTFRVRDDSGSADDTDLTANSFTIDVRPVNDAPVLANLGGDTSSFTEGALLVQLDTGIALALNDVDSADFEGGSLTVSIVANGVPGEDILAFNPFGSVSIAGSAVSVAGTPVGTISSNGANGDPLVVDFNAFATPALVQVLISTLAYANSNVLDPATTQREISIALADGDGTANGGANTLVVTSYVGIESVNDAPSGTDGSATLDEDMSYVFSAADFGFSDVEGDAFAGVTITTLATDGTLRLGGLAVIAGGFVAAANIAANLLTFEPGADGSGSNDATFTFQVRDDGGTVNGGIDTDPNANTFTFDVIADNDAPLLGNLAGDNSSFTEDGAPVLLDDGSNASVSDIDSTDFGGGSLTVSVVANGVSTEDLLGIDQSGNVSIAGTTVSVGATAIGTITGNGANGNDLVIALNASATPLLVQDLVRALTYANTNLLNPDTTGRSIAITLVDGDGVANGGGDSVLVNVGTAITPVDDAPVAIDDAITVAEDQVATGSLFADNGSGADSDLDGPALQVAAVNGVGANVGAAIALASGALLTVNANGSYSYDPNGMFDYLAAPGSGADNSPATETFTYTLVNGNTATVTVSITGVDGKDVLIGTAGDDTMSGGTNEDRLYGRAGNDFLFGDRDGDQLYGEDGDDWLDGGSGHDELYGGAGNDTLYGGLHNDRLDGGSGADTMIGGTGHDTYIVDNAGDAVIELGSGGNDKVESAISFNLPTHVEKLILTGSFGLVGRGNSANNEIFGNSGNNFLNGNKGDDQIDGGAGNDRIYGSEGNDTLIGSAGNDRFHFNTAPGPDNVDAILDFTVGEDLIYLAKYAFTALGEPRTGLSAAAFQAGPTALEADDRILYDQASGNIFYDRDGNGSAEALLFATVAAGTPLTHADFYLYG